MKCRMISGFAALVLILMVVFPADASSRSTLLTDVQYWLAPDHIQTIITFDQAVDMSYHHRSNPARFVIEIPDCRDLYGSRQLIVNDRTLQKIRVQRLQSGTTQIVFDLTKKVEADVQLLPQVNGQPDRIVVNLLDESRQAPPAQITPPPLQPVKQERAERSRTVVVIDPGHGGRDPGATGRNGLKEKDIVLDLALQIKKILQKKAPQLTVHLTRDDDTFLPLRKRAEIAREQNADLFISLHVNANKNRRVNGFSVYTLSEEATDEAARKLAEKENAVELLFEGIKTPTPADDSLLTFVLADLTTTAALHHSLEFGRLSVHTTVARLKKYGIHNEGLRRANFAVLRSANMPAVLVEACYVSNRREEKLLKQKDFRATLSQSLASSILEYFQELRAPTAPQLVRAENQTQQISFDKEETSSTYKVHVVQSGESLSKIAGKYNVNLTQLRQVNKLASADLIYIGQELWIP